MNVPDFGFDLKISFDIGKAWRRWVDRVLWRVFGRWENVIWKLIFQSFLKRLTLIVDAVDTVDGFVGDAPVSNVVCQLQVVGLDDTLLDEFQGTRSNGDLFGQPMRQLGFLKPLLGLDDQGRDICFFWENVVLKLLVWSNAKNALPQSKSSYQDAAPAACWGNLQSERAPNVSLQYSSARGYSKLKIGNFRQFLGDLRGRIPWHCSVSGSRLVWSCLSSAKIRFWSFH